MSASDALQPHQFVHHSELASMYSGDYDVPMSKVLPEMRESNFAGNLSLHDSYEEHGGPDQYVAHLAKDITKNGIHRPITVRGGNVITDGHHRALAAMRAGMARVPIVHER